MYKKNCPFCRKDSYSAASRGRWECPHCKADLTIFVPEPAGSVKNGHGAEVIINADPGTTGDKIGGKVRNKLVLLMGGKKQAGYSRPKNTGHHTRWRNFRHPE